MSDHPASPEPADAPAADPPRRRRRQRVPRPLRRTALALVFLLALNYLVLPQVAGARQAATVLVDLNPWLVLLGLALQAAAIVTYTLFTRSLLPEPHPRVDPLLRIQLSTLTVTNLVPGGSAAGGALGVRLLNRLGVSLTDATFALATAGLGSAVVLNVLLWLGLLLSIPLRGFQPVSGTVAIVGVVLIGGFAAAVLLLVRGQDRAERGLRAVGRRIPLVDSEALVRIARHLAERLQTLAADPPLLWRAIGWSSLNWALSMASLWVFVAAYGHRVPLDGLVIAFGLANVSAAIPLTPGGVGIVEVVMTSTLVGFGIPRGEALLGVVTFRLASFWLPIPLGALAYLSLHVGPVSIDRHRRREERRAELRRLAEEALAEAETRAEWAERVGIRAGPGDTPGAAGNTGPAGTGRPGGPAG
ncbi:MAG: flippase-like domain-containing protein [Acidimicrobiales bacterium]|nr:flippase-like domain-containing protein [Acidimicrobiales bacterium]